MSAVQEVETDEIDTRSLDSSLSEIEVDCGLRVEKRQNGLKSRTTSPLLHYRFPDKDNQLTDLFLNQETGYSFNDICSLKEVQQAVNEPDTSPNEISSCGCPSHNLKSETIRYGLTKKIHANARKRHTSKYVYRRLRVNDVDETAKPSEELRFEYISTDYLKDVCTCLAKLSPTKAAYVKEIVVKQDIDGDRLIFISIIMKRLDLCNAMIAFIPDECFLKTAQNNLYQTALHLSVLVGCPKLTRRFLVAGVQVDRRDHKGDTALHIACKRGNTRVVMELLKPVTYLETKQNPYDVSYQKVPQNLEIRNSDGLTCLHLAAYNKNTELIDMLLSKFADINAVDLKNGQTCLHIFSEADDVKCVDYLLKKPKVNVNARTYAGFTALEIANCRKHSYVAYLLLCAGAKPKIRRVDSDDFRADSDSD